MANGIGDLEPYLQELVNELTVMIRTYAVDPRCGSEVKRLRIALDKAQQALELVRAGGGARS